MTETPKALNCLERLEKVRPAGQPHSSRAIKALCNEIDDLRSTIRAIRSDHFAKIEEIEKELQARNEWFSVTWGKGVFVLAGKAREGKVLAFRSTDEGITWVKTLEDPEEKAND